MVGLLGIMLETETDGSEGLVLV
uniref:Uncharacterized protein n=1 Tax=Rhizophora mucronata TaxID=61149 RepID=A0A2P2NF08_RHIMU